VLILFLIIKERLFVTIIKTKLPMSNVPEHLVLLFIENPLLDMTIDDNDSVLHTKYNLQHGQASLATPEQLPIFDEVYHMEGRKSTPGGSSLNSARAANHILRKENAGNVAFIGCIGNDDAGNTLVEALKEVQMIGEFARTEETGTG
jgi:sugar/nucleoside kinase (ribokinase family)